MMRTVFKIGPFAKKAIINHSGHDGHNENHQIRLTFRLPPSSQAPLWLLPNGLNPPAGLAAGR
jgi:hypothetical protein